MTIAILSSIPHQPQLIKYTNSSSVDHDSFGGAKMSSIIRTTKHKPGFFVDTYFCVWTIWRSFRSKAALAPPTGTIKLVPGLRSGEEKIRDNALVKSPK